jgi:hypothetical protein
MYEAYRFQWMEIFKKLKIVKNPDFALKRIHKHTHALTSFDKSSLYSGPSFCSTIFIFIMPSSSIVSEHLRKKIEQIQKLLSRFSKLPEIIKKILKQDPSVISLNKIRIIGAQPCSPTVTVKQLSQ